MITIQNLNQTEYRPQVSQIVEHTNGEIGIVMSLGLNCKVCILNAKSTSNNLYGNWEFKSIKNFRGKIVIEQ